MRLSIVLRITKIEEEADNIPQDLHNSLDDVKAVSNNIVLLFKIIPTM